MRWSARCVLLTSLVLAVGLMSACATTRSDAELCDLFEVEACARIDQAAGIHPADLRALADRQVEALRACQEGDHVACTGVYQLQLWGFRRGQRLPDDVAQGMAAACAEEVTEVACPYWATYDWVFDGEEEDYRPHLLAACETLGDSWCNSYISLLAANEEWDAVRERYEQAAASCLDTGEMCRTALGGSQRLHDHGHPVDTDIVPRLREGACRNRSTTACRQWYSAEPDQRPAVTEELEFGCQTGDITDCLAIRELQYRWSEDPEVRAAAFDEGARYCAAGLTDACGSFAWLAQSTAPEGEYIKRVDLLRSIACFEHESPYHCDLLLDSFAAGHSTAERTVHVAQHTCAVDPEWCARAGGTLLFYPELPGREQSVGWVQGGCDRGAGWACDQLADYFDGRWGDRIDLERSMYFRWQGCELGYIEACDSLEDLAMAASGASSWVSMRFRAARDLCRAGEATGCLDAGRILAEDLVPPEAERAQPYLERACDEELGAACRILGSLHINGYLASETHQVGIDYFERGCQVGDSDACNYLGVVAESQMRLDYQMSDATESYRRACDSGSAIGCSNLGWLLLEAASGGVATPEVVDLAQRACPNSDEAFACELLGFLVEHGDTGAPPDVERALGLYEAACDAENHRGCLLAADVHSHREDGEDASYNFYRRGCNYGGGESCYYQALAQRLGYGVSKNHGFATAALQQSCAIGFARGCEQLGWAYFDGMGVRPDFDRALRAWQRACDLGLADACALLDQWDERTRPISPAKPASLQ